MIDGERHDRITDAVARLLDTFADLERREHPGADELAIHVGALWSFTTGALGSLLAATSIPTDEIEISIERVRQGLDSGAEGPEG